MKRSYPYLLCLLLMACSSEESMLNAQSSFADITAVRANGTDGSYNFSVTIGSPDTGCEQYADWWEVLNEDGALIYRRILAHSHVDEQPFTRSGGPVDISADQIVFIRAHMNNSGYGGTIFKGSVDVGFSKTEVSDDFAKEVESQEPLPTNCAF